MKACKFNKNKFIEDIDLNQNYLIQAVEQLELKTKKVILDGHFCLLNEKGEITKLNISTFQRLPIIGVILVVDSIEAITNRLSSRDGKVYDYDLLEEFQNTEKQHYEQIALELNLLHYSFKATDETSGLETYFNKIENIVGGK